MANMYCDGKTDLLHGDGGRQVAQEDGRGLVERPRLWRVVLLLFLGGNSIETVLA